jgi:hypothetical protein
VFNADKSEKFPIAAIGSLFGQLQWRIANISKRDLSSQEDLLSFGTRMFRRQASTSGQY